MIVLIIKYPEKVDKNTTIGVTATSSAVDMLKFQKAKEKLTKLGYNIVETSNVYKKEKLVSSSGIERANEFISLWENEDVSHIIAATGGEFLMEMLPYLHNYKEKIETCKPKWVQGFSDTSLLNFYLTTNYNIATVHAQNFGSFAMRKYHKSLEDTLNMTKLGQNEEYIQKSFDKYSLQRDENDVEAEYNLVYDNEYKLLNGENSYVKVSGRLIGGCIDVIKTIIGTPFDNTNNFCSNFNEGMIWYLENCELSVADLYRALWQMKQAGWFKNVNAFLIGRTLSKESYEDYTYEDALKDALLELNVPIIYDIDLGHIPPQMTYINGAYAEFELVDKNKGILKQKNI